MLTHRNGPHTTVAIVFVSECTNSMSALICFCMLFFFRSSLRLFLSFSFSVPLLLLLPPLLRIRLRSFACSPAQIIVIAITVTVARQAFELHVNVFGVLMYAHGLPCSESERENNRFGIQGDIKAIQFKCSFKFHMRRN